MRIRARLLPAALACLALASGGTGAVAQSSPFNFFDLFRPRPPQQYYQPAQPRRVNPYVQKKKAPAPRTVIVEDTNKPKVDPGTFVMVVGDSLSELLAQGLEEAVSDKPDIAVVDKSKGDSGLVNSEFYDWPKAVGELLNGKDKISLGVMMVGANDRQAIREGGESHAPGTPKWEQIYAARIDSIVKAFAEKKIPLIWVGMPPMKSDRISTDMVALNTPLPRPCAGRRRRLRRRVGSLCGRREPLHGVRARPFRPEHQAAHRRRRALHQGGSAQARAFRRCRAEAAHRHAAPDRGGAAVAAERSRCSTSPYPATSSA